VADRAKRQANSVNLEMVFIFIVNIERDQGRKS
jgi:hypothetical protein